MPHCFPLTFRPGAIWRTLFIMGLALCGTPRQPAAAQDKILRWHDQVDTAARASRVSGKPIFVVFRCVR